MQARISRLHLACAPYATRVFTDGDCNSSRLPVLDVPEPTPTCPWPTEGEALTWACHQKGEPMTPYRDRMNQGVYGEPIASTTSQDLGGVTKQAKQQKAKSTSTARRSKRA